MRYFFVCGAPKSGTTWLQRILDSHPEVTCSGEGAFVEKLLLPMLQTVEKYNKHLELVAERVYQGQPYYAALRRNEAAALARSAAIHMMKQRATAGTKALGDKTPRYAEFLDALHAWFPAAPIFHIYRDPRDVAVSRLHHALRAGYPDALTPGTATQRQLLRNAAAAWRVAQERCFTFGEKHPEFFFEVSYESLLDAAGEPIKKLVRLLGVDDSPDLIERMISDNRFEKLSGRKPGEEDKGSFFRKGIVGDWRNVLDGDGLATIEEHCGAMMRKRHYDPEIR